MKELNQYLESMNLRRELFGEPRLTLPLSARELLEVKMSIEVASSPENLAQDGELNATQVRVRARRFSKVLSQLENANV